MSKTLKRPAHLPSKRGVITETKVIETGTLYQYSSGYIEHEDAKGRKTDVLYDLYLRRHAPRNWKCMKTNGGGVVEYDGVDRDDAMSRCARDLGPVLYTDDHHAFIFYRDKSAPAGPSQIVTPQ